MQTRWIMLLVLFLVRLAMGYQFQSVASVSSILVTEFGFSYAQIGTLIGFFLLPGIVVAIPSGLMTRAVADKNLVMLGAAAMIAGGVIMAMAGTPSALYTGRLITGIGGSIFNIILTKMVMEWFFEKEIITALAVLLTAWPAGIALGLLSQGFIADIHGWSWVMYATAGLALAALLLTAFLYREAPGSAVDNSMPLRFSLPPRQFVHTGLAGLAWSLINAAIIIVVSFGPDALIERGFDDNAARGATSLVMWVGMIAGPIGGRAMEALDYVTPTIIISFLIAAVATVAIAQGVAPEISFVVVGLFVSLPVGSIMALSAEASSPENRGPGLGIFFTWYYVGMALAPVLAGWTRDVSGSAAAPIMLAAAMIVTVIVSVGILRLLQRIWPIEPAAA